MRSTETSSENNESSSNDNPIPSKPVVRTRPTYFKTTQSSRNKLGKEEVANTGENTRSKPKDIPVKKSRSRSMIGIKAAMYASTPNLICGIENEDEEEILMRHQKATKRASASNLALLSD